MWKGNILERRAYFSSSVINGKIYVIGGTGNPPLSTIEEYDTRFDSNSINLKGKLPTTWSEAKTALNR